MDKESLHSENYSQTLYKKLTDGLKKEIISYKDWLEFAELKAKIRVAALQDNCNYDFSDVEERFQQFILAEYGNLADKHETDYPLMLPKVINHIAGNREKTALIVLDGMSLFDFEIIKEEFKGISYGYYKSFALIPTLTPVSRQCLLCGKFPIDLEDPFRLKKEEELFRENLENLGCSPGEIVYTKEYKPNIYPETRFIAVILKDFDDTLHNQNGGFVAQLKEIYTYARSGRLQALIKDLHNKGFKVYLTADHGNTEAIGLGEFNAGVHIETKSKKIILSDNLALNDSLRTNRKLIEYPPYYLNNKYTYFLCKPGVSYDKEGLSVFTHGGMSLDEVIVPFVEITGATWE